MSAPLILRYEGDGEFKSAGMRWARQADKDFVVGETYTFVEHQERSVATHRHYFAAVTKAWQSLPDALLDEYPTAEHLRKKMLIKCGFADERSIVCASKAEAQRVAAFIKPMDDYAVVTVREAVVRVYTAKSQTHRAMDRKQFAESKERVLLALDDLLGTEPGTVAKQEAAA